jgi:hypothetical protein
MHLSPETEKKIVCLSPLSRQAWSHDHEHEELRQKVPGQRG